MSKRDAMVSKLEVEFSPLHLEVVDETFMHNVPPDSESHFKIVIVSKDFKDKSLLQRHRAIQAVINISTLQIHALALHPFAPKEWKNSPDNQSPKCLGGTGQ